jgi:hypothetical protein
MIIILGLLALAVILLAVHFLSEDQDMLWLMFGTLFSVFFGVALLVCGMERLSIRGEVAGLEATRLSFQVARSSSDIAPIELAAIQQSVAEKNAWLAEVKYYAQSPFTNWFIPQDIVKVEPIK